MFGVIRNRRGVAGAVAGVGAGAGPAGDDVGGTLHPKDDGYFSETTGQEDDEDDDDEQEDDEQEDAEQGDDEGESHPRTAEQKDAEGEGRPITAEQKDAEGEGRPITADEMIAAYDKTYIAMYPDRRLKQVVASHEHLRHWNYCPITGTSKPRTNHELQWLDVHGHDADVQKLADTDTPATADQTDEPATDRRVSLHKMYLSMKRRIYTPHTSPNRSSERDSLRHIAESDSSSSEMESVSPAKNEIMRMLHDTHDPTLQGVCRSSKQIIHR